MSRPSLSIRSVSLSVMSALLFCLMAIAQDAPPAQDVPQGPPAPPNAVAQGTVALIQLSDRIDATTRKAGNYFHARLGEALTEGVDKTLPDRVKIKGHVSAAYP